MQDSDILREIFSHALGAVDPYKAVTSRGERILWVMADGGFRDAVIVGFGKASVDMARAIEAVLGDRTARGHIITKYGHTRPGCQLRKISVSEGGHPLPDANGVEGTHKATEILRGTGASTLVICLISGGGSALLVSPAEGITLAQKQRTTDLLLRAGCDIFELNTVRKHISAVKGGRLAEIAYPSKVLSLIVSDVLGDRLDVIASGPTYHDPSTFGDAHGVLEKYGLVGLVPDTVIQRLRKGMEGAIGETPKEGSPFLRHVDNLLIANLDVAIHAAKDKAESLGYRARIVSNRIRGEAADAALMLAGEAMKEQDDLNQGDSVCLISGGETTVAVRGNGKGGRNMEIALVFSEEIQGRKGISFLSAGTDGTDGPTDAAGAIVDGDTHANAVSKGLDPQAYLKDNDSYHYFDAFDGLLKTGPTGTNVMDLQIILVRK